MSDISWFIDLFFYNYKAANLGFSKDVIHGWHCLRIPLLVGLYNVYIPLNYDVKHILHTINKL